MAGSISCPDCSNDIPQPATACPHCGRPGVFWNVIAAGSADERAALQLRYDTAGAAVTRGAKAVVQDFETAVNGSKAVIARSIAEVQRLANSGQLYATYYQLIEAGLKLPDNDEWNQARELADTVLFPNYKQQIRFAALSLDGLGLTKYGGCSIQLRDNMIAHRASVIEENSVMFMEHHEVRVARITGMPKGYLATWGERGKLCIAKLAGLIDSTTTPNQYSKLLLKQGATSADDEFVEVHIWGALSVLSIEKVTITDSEGAAKKTLKRLTAQLAKYGVTVA